MRRGTTLRELTIEGLEAVIDQHRRAPKFRLRDASYGKGGLVEVQGTAEGEPFDRALLDGMLDLAASGIEQLVAMQRAVLTE